MCEMTSIQKHFFWLVFLGFVFQNKTLEENKMKISGNGYTALIQLGVTLVSAGELAQAVRCLSKHEVLSYTLQTPMKKRQGTNE